jgi:hypothetical protein
VPRSRATILPLRGPLEITRMSAGGMPPARSRAAIASADFTVSPTESVVLISTSSV